MYASTNGTGRDAMGVARAKEFEGDATAAVLLFLGYSLYKTVMLDSYVTDFGLVHDSVGYISNLAFMMAASVGIAFTSVGIFLWRRRYHAPFAMPYRAPLVLMLVGYVCFHLRPPGFSWCGVLWGCAATMLTIVYAEMFAYETSPMVVILQLAFSAFFSAALVLALGEAPAGARFVAHALMLACCWATIRSGRAGLHPYEVAAAETAGQGADGEKPLGLGPACKDASLPVVAYALFEMVIGLVNMFAWSGRSSFVIATSAPMWGMLICAGLLVVFVMIANRIPNPSLMYLAVFPLAIGCFLLRPFLGHLAGPQLSVAIYTAYIFTSPLASFWYIVSCRTFRADIYQVAACVQLLARCTLMAGLGIGYACAQTPGGEPLMRTGVVVAICVYLLLVVIVYGGFRSSSQKRAEVVVRRVPESFEEASKHKIDSLAERYGLTRRECDVYVSLLKGGTAKSIAEQLSLSPYTVQGHIQNLYAKLGVNKKEQALELFYENPAEQDAEAPA